jgi:hypothetical protein
MNLLGAVCRAQLHKKIKKMEILKRTGAMSSRICTICMYIHGFGTNSAYLRIFSFTVKSAKCTKKFVR